MFSVEQVQESVTARETVSYRESDVLELAVVHFDDLFFQPGVTGLFVIEGAFVILGEPVTVAEHESTLTLGP